MPKGIPNNPEVKQDSICWDCGNAIPTADGKYGCEWSCNREPVPGWTATKTIVDKGFHGYCSYCVTDCPKFTSKQPKLEKIHEASDFYGLIETAIKRAVLDYSEMYTEILRCISVKQMDKVLELSKGMTDIESWFYDSCCGFIEGSTARLIMKHLKEDTIDYKSEYAIPKNIKDALSKDIRTELLHYIRKSESNQNVMNAYRKAEYEMSVAFHGNTNLCKICRNWVVGNGRCHKCRFSWKGKPLE